MTYTIYALVDPRDGATRYVGCTSKPLEKRLVQHMKATDATNRRKYEWLYELHQAGLRPDIIALEETANSPSKAEHRWITAKRAEGCALLNTARRVGWYVEDALSRRGILAPGAGSVAVDERWFTPKQMADRLLVDEQTVRRWLRLGQLRGHYLSRQAGWRVKESDVNAFLEERARRGDEPRAD